MSLKPLLIAALVACAPLKADRKDAQAAQQKQLKSFESPGLTMGEFTLARKAVVDGDTVHVAGIDASLRLLAIDTEETFKHEKDRRAFEQGWEAYLKEMRGTSSRPVKMATPVGMEAKQFADDFFEDVKRVRLERDHPKEIRDYYNRYLSYVFVEKNGVWLNYNVECVRAGMSPYFSKYGYSRRYHADFVAAEKEAREAHRGIWDPAKQHYPDYPERKVWWDGRAEFIKKFEEDAQGKDNFVVLTNYDTPLRLELAVGKKIVLLGAISDIKLGDKGPTRVLLSRKRTSDFPLIFFDKDLFITTGLAQKKGEYVRVTGVVAKYHNKKANRDELQIVVEHASQVVGQEEAAKPQASRKGQ